MYLKFSNCVFILVLQKMLVASIKKFKINKIIRLKIYKKKCFLIIKICYLGVLKKKIRLQKYQKNYTFFNNKNMY